MLASALEGLGLDFVLVLVLSGGWGGFVIAIRFVGAVLAATGLLLISAHVLIARGRRLVLAVASGVA